MVDDFRKFTRKTLESFNRAKLQQLYKTHGLKGANARTSAMVDALLSYYDSPNYQAASAAHQIAQPSEGGPIRTAGVGPVGVRRTKVAPPKPYDQSARPSRIVKPKASIQNIAKERNGGTKTPVEAATSSSIPIDGSAGSASPVITQQPVTKTSVSRVNAKSIQSASSSSTTIIKAADNALVSQLQLQVQKLEEQVSHLSSEIIRLNAETMLANDRLQSLEEEIRLLKEEGSSTSKAMEGLDPSLVGVLKEFTQRFQDELSREMISHLNSIQATQSVSTSNVAKGKKRAHDVSNEEGEEHIEGAEAGEVSLVEPHAKRRKGEATSTGEDAEGDNRPTEQLEVTLPKTPQVQNRLQLETPIVRPNIREVTPTAGQAGERSPQPKFATTPRPQEPSSPLLDTPATSSRLPPAPSEPQMLTPGPIGTLRSKSHDRLPPPPTSNKKQRNVTDPIGLLHPSPAIRESGTLLQSQISGTGGLQYGSTGFDEASIIIHDAAFGSELHGQARFGDQPVPVEFYDEGAVTFADTPKTVRKQPARV